MSTIESVPRAPFDNSSLSVFEDNNKLYLPWDNPDNIISLETFLSFEKFANCGMNVVLFVVGVPTNIVSALVFYRQGLKDRMNMCLFCLALVDMLFIACFFLVGSFCIVGHFRPDVEQWWKYFTRTSFTGLYRGFMYCSGCLTMVISVERCVCVVWPLKAATLIKTSTIAGIIATIVVTIQAACVLYPLQLSIGSRLNVHTGEVMLFLTTTDFYYRHKLLFDIVENTLLMIVVPFTTFAVVTLATVITVVHLRRAIAWRTTTSGVTSSDVREKALVKMLVVVSCIYIACSSPNIALGLTRQLVTNFHHTRKFANIFLACHLIYLELALVNSSVNFFVYLSRSSRYKKELCALFRLNSRQLKSAGHGWLSQETKNVTCHSTTVDQ